MKVTLCDPTTQHSCPTVEVTDTKTVLTDDFGGKVVMQPHEWDILRQMVKDGSL